MFRAGRGMQIVIAAMIFAASSSPLWGRADDDLLRNYEVAVAWAKHAFVSGNADSEYLDERNARDTPQRFHVEFQRWTDWPRGNLERSTKLVSAPVSSAARTNLKNEPQITRRVVQANGAWLYTRYEDEPPVRVQHWSTPQKVDEIGRGVMEDDLGGGFLDGYVSFGGRGRLFLPEFARNATALNAVPELETVNGLACRPLRLERDGVRITLWFCPQRGMNVVQFTLEQDEHSKFLDELERPFARATAVFDCAVLSEVKGRWILTGGHYLTRAVRDDGSQVISNTTVTRDEIQLTPSIDRAMFALDEVPDGTPVGWKDIERSGVAYVMRAGDVVGEDDDKSVATSERSPARVRVPKWVRTIFLALLTAGVAGLAIRWSIRRRAA